MNADNGLDPMAQRLYEVFASYSSPGSDFCSYCYTPEETSLVTGTPVRELDVEAGRALLWESADHWESADVYRHYVPRMLEILGPPWLVDDLYPLHLFETLRAVGFHGWPRHEQAAIADYLDQLGQALADTRRSEHREECAAGVAALRDPRLALPAPGAEET